MRPKLWLENPKGRTTWNYPVVGGSIILEWMLNKQGWKVWTEFICLSLRTSGGVLWTWCNKRWEICWL